jgi:hemolysin III
MAMRTEVAAAPREKPLLRGVSHQIAFFCALTATAVLVLRAAPGAATASATIFGFSLVALFGTSALYHRVDWSPSARKRMRRLDHAAIFLLIAGGYTPLFALVPSTSGGQGALAVIWIGAAVGVLKSLAWPDGPKWAIALLCVALGWAVIGQVVDRVASVGWLSIGLLIASGATYSLGALVYALKRPDPFPRVFGYHEIFHALVVLASACLFAHVVTVLVATSSVHQGRRSYQTGSAVASCSMERSASRTSRGVVSGRAS